MKRYLCYICIIAIILSFCGCANTSTKLKKPAKFYYLTDPENYQSNAITPELRESSEYTDDLRSLIQVYLEGPTSSLYINPFPQKTIVQDITVNNVTVEIILNDAFSQLNEVELTSACACLTMTILDLTERQRLIITTLDNVGNVVYTTSMTKEHILLSDTD